MKKIISLNLSLEKVNNPSYNKLYKTKSKGRGGSRARQKTLSKRRKSAVTSSWNEYESKYFRLMSSPFGTLLQSKHLKDDIENNDSSIYAGFGKKRNLNDGFVDILTRQTTQNNWEEFFWGGHSLKKHAMVLGEKYIDYAIEDVLATIKKQVQLSLSKLNKMSLGTAKESSLESLVAESRANPGALGRVLALRPSYAGLICKTSLFMAKEKKKVEFWDKVWVGSGFLVGGVLILTGVGSQAGVLTIAGTISSLGATIGGVVHDHAVYNKNLEQKSKTLNSMLIGTSDEESIKDLVSLEGEAASRKFGWKAGLYLAPLDVLGVVQSRKVISQSVKKYHQKFKVRAHPQGQKRKKTIAVSKSSETHELGKKLKADKKKIKVRTTKLQKQNDLFIEQLKEDYVNLISLRNYIQKVRSGKNLSVEQRLLLSLGLGEEDLLETV